MFSVGTRNTTTGQRSSNPGGAPCHYLEVDKMRKLIPVVGPILAAVLAVIPVVGPILAAVVA